MLKNASKRRSIPLVALSIDAERNSLGSSESTLSYNVQTLTLALSVL
jgi:hypothetical protein